MDKEYKILNVQNREPWSGTYGTFNQFALQLEGVDGWVELSQKQDTAAPAVGGTLFGHLDTQKSKDGTKTYLKFKKVSRNPGFGGSSINQKDIDYIIMMLEELTLRREQPDNPTGRDSLPTDDDMNKPINLADIPFN